MEISTEPRWPAEPAPHAGDYGCGTVFKLTPRGKLTMVYSFCAQTNCTDGFELFGGLVQGSDGNLYGTTAEGGANGYGTVFKLTTAGKLTTLHNFASYPDGAYPEAALIQGTDGNFYGTTPKAGPTAWPVRFSKSRPLAR